LIEEFEKESQDTPCNLGVGSVPSIRHIPNQNKSLTKKMILN